MISVSIKNLSFKYTKSDWWNIEDFSMDYEEGSITAIVGGNGSGKTTLLRCICGISPRIYKGEIKGEVRIYGRDISTLKIEEVIQDIGIVFQNPETQIFLSTVEDELVFGPENLCIPRDEIEVRLNETLDLIGLNHLRYKNPVDLSGGEQQLVTLGSVLMMNPRVLLLDEIMSWVDSTRQIEIREILKVLKNNGKTIIMVDHQFENIELADKVIRM